MLSNRAFAAVGVLLAVCMVIAGCGRNAAPPEKAGSPAGSKASQTLIGVLVPLSGESASKGKGVLDGLALALKRKGSAVGLDESAILKRDCGESAADTLALARALVDVEGVDALVGPLDEKGVDAVRELARQKSVPLFTTASGALEPSVLGSTVRRLSFTSVEEGAAVAEFAAKKLFRNAAVFVDENMPASEARAKAFAERFKTLGGQVVSQVSYPGGEKEFRRLVRMSASQKPSPDVYYLTGGAAESTAIVDELKTQKVFGGVLGSASWDVASPFPVEVGPGFPVFVPCRFFAGSADLAAADFVKAFKAAYGRDPGICEAQGYDAGLAIIDALTRAGDKREEFAAKVASTAALSGATGKLAARPWSLASQVLMLRLKGKSFELDSAVDIK